MKQVILLTIFIVRVSCDDDSGWAFVGNPLLHARPCNDSKDITLSYEPGLPPGEENKYTVFIMKQFPTQSKVTLRFDVDASVVLVSNVGQS